MKNFKDIFDQFDWNEVTDSIYAKTRQDVELALNKSDNRDIEDFNKSLLNIYSWEVLEEIKNNSPGWEQKLPEAISKLIKEKRLFGYSN